jgi:hypothetical protein
MRLLWLADVLRAAGLNVVEVDGWKTRGSDSYGPLRGLVCHETRGSATSSDSGEIRVLVEGRVGLSGPIAQLYLSRTGVWHVVASGTCHHVKTGWGGIHAGYGNDSLIGVEAAHAESEDWAAKPAQYDSYVRGGAAICKHMGWDVGLIVGHKEHQPGDKPDPEFSMNTFRNRVEDLQEDDMPTAKEIADAVWTYNAGSRANPTTAIARLNQAAANVVDLGQRLDAILAAALDDGDLNVTLSPEMVVELQEIRAAVGGIPTEVEGAFRQVLGSLDEAI